MTQLDSEIICYNARGIADGKKRKKIFNYLKKKSSTKAIIFIQESHSDKNSENLWRYQWRGEIYFSHGTKSSRGALIAFRNGLEYKVLSEVCDTEGRYVIVKIEIQGALFYTGKLLWPKYTT